MNGREFIGKFYAVAPVEMIDQGQLVRVGWAVVAWDNDTIETIMKNKSRKAMSKVAHEMNAALEES